MFLLPRWFREIWQTLACVAIKLMTAFSKLLCVSDIHANTQHPSLSAFSMPFDAGRQSASVKPICQYLTSNNAAEIRGSRLMKSQCGHGCDNWRDSLDQNHQMQNMSLFLVAQLLFLLLLWFYCSAKLQVKLPSTGHLDYFMVNCEDCSGQQI